jgi:glycosyltransferase involved in cell wall biosynthesis
MPDVSVIIPVFNSARFVSTALASVFAQTFRSFEVVLVDDGSEDQRELDAVLAPWIERIHCIRQPNGGPARARNTGIARAAGELIAFLDADDEWFPEKLARQVEYFRRYPETGLLHSGVLPHTNAGRATEAPPRNAFCDLFHTSFFINTLSVMVPRAVVLEVGGFDERREIHIEDWDLWLRIAARYPIGYISEALAYHRPGGYMSRQVDRTFASQGLVIDKNWALCQQACAAHRAAPGHCERTRRHVLHRDWGCDRLVAGDRAGAREQLGHAIAWAPWHARTYLLYASTFGATSWRSRVRGLALMQGRREAAPAVEPARPGRTVPSLIHDTLYRRCRQRVVRRLHDVDDGLWRTFSKRRRVLFEAGSPMNVAIFRPVYERLKRDPRLELWFTACSQEWQPREIFASAGITHNVVSAATAATMKVDAYVNADFWEMTWLYRRTRRIHLFHGVAGKYGLDAPVALAPIIATFDCLMFANADRRERYIDAGLVADDDRRAALVGYPKVDCLVDGSLDRTAITRGLGLDPAAPTIVYAPTWSPLSSLHTMGEEIVERLAAEGLQVIVKLHDRSYDSRERGSGGIDWAGRFRRFDSHPTVRVVREADGCPFLAASDAMVSDHSSIAFEYMLLDRPIVVIDRPELIQKAGISADKVRRLRSAAAVATTAHEMMRALVMGLTNPKQLSDARRRCAADLFHQPGTATARALALIYELIGLSAAPDAVSAAEPDRQLAPAG